MKDNEFVTSVINEIVDSNMSRYISVIRGAKSEGLDRHWPTIAKLANGLSDDQRRELADVIRIVLEDTISNFLGILDGTTMLSRFRESFHLVYNSDGHDLNGNLQDIFLANRR